jgi:hypothetical protein
VCRYRPRLQSWREVRRRQVDVGRVTELAREGRLRVGAGVSNRRARNDRQQLHRDVGGNHAGERVLHDIGSVDYLDIINKAAKLSEQDYNKVKEHPKVGLNVLNEFWKDPPAAVSEVVSQEHERLDGSGYPRGIKGKDISEFAQIVALVDIYEAMIHQRPYRNKHTPSETVNTILTNKNAFGYRVIKVLIERMGIFPVGFMVRLNNKEIGLVVKENPKSPLRPVVDIIFTPDNKKLEKPKQIDLARNPVICIEECLERLKKE